VQLRFKTNLTSERYVSEKAWQDATLERCPLHPYGGCSLARHGTYERKKPAGTQVARWYCPEGHTTFSLLPDCLAARLSGSLHDVEVVVDRVEQADTVEAAADRLRLDIELPGALRWTRRRFQPIHAALTTLKGLSPERFSDCAPTLASFRQRLGVAAVLPALREIAAVHLAFLLPPLGFRSPPLAGGEPKRGHQHRTGTDPPSSSQ